MVMVVSLFASTQLLRAESAHRIGVGANYWMMLDDIDVDNIDEDGVSWLATYQYKAAALLKLEADLEVFPDDFEGLDGVVYAPQAYLVVGSTIYAALGVGVFYADGDFADDPFYALRAGLDLEILPQLYLDLNANYRFADWAHPSDIADDIDGDTLMLGAAVRLEL